MRLFCYYNDDILPHPTATLKFNNAKNNDIVYR